MSGYSSRKRSPDGDWNNATGTLTQLDHPGHFSQELVFGGFEGPAVDYNVVWLDEESAIEYKQLPEIIVVMVTEYGNGHRETCNAM